MKKIDDEKYIATLESVPPGRLEDKCEILAAIKDPSHQVSYFQNYSTPHKERWGHVKHFPL